MDCLFSSGSNEIDYELHPYNPNIAYSHATQSSTSLTPNLIHQRLSIVAREAGFLIDLTAASFSPHSPSGYQSIRFIEPTLPSRGHSCEYGYRQTLTTDADSQF